MRRNFLTVIVLIKFFENTFERTKPTRRFKTEVTGEDITKPLRYWKE